MPGSVSIVDSTLQNAVSVDKSGNISFAPVPAGATLITATSGNVAAGAAAATLAAAVGKTTYITGFDITAGGATGALLVTATVAGVVTGTLSYTYAAPAGVAVGATPLSIQFRTPIPASGTNVTIVVTLPSLGSGNAKATVNAYGYQI